MYDTTGARMASQVWTGRDYTDRPLAADAVTGVPTDLPAAPADRADATPRARRFGRRERVTTSRFAPA